MLRDAMLPLRAIADSIAARGITHITGRVVAGGDAFPGAVLGYGWSYDDFEDSYSAPIDELLFNEGFSELHVRGGERAGDPVSVDVGPARSVPARPQPARVPSNRRLTADARGRRARLRARKDSATWDIVLEGEIGVRDSASIEVTHHDPDRRTSRQSREALRDKGIDDRRGRHRHDRASRHARRRSRRRR